MKTIKLNIIERILLPQMMLQQGGKIEMILNRSILQKIEFTINEINEFELKDESNGIIHFNPKKNKETAFEFTSEQVEILKSAAKRTDEDKMITMQNLSLVEKIDKL